MPAPYTWLDFKEAVKTLLTTDGVRMGSEEFIEMHTRAAVLDLQRVVPRYRKGHQETLKHNQLAARGRCSVHQLPTEAELREVLVERTKADETTLLGFMNIGSEVDNPVYLQITGQDNDFPNELKEGDAIALSLDYTQYAIVTEIVSSDTLVIDRALPKGFLQTIKKVTVQRHPADPYDFRNLGMLISGQACVNDNRALMTVDPVSGELYVYPLVEHEDESGFTHKLLLSWDGIKHEWAENDMTPFDDLALYATADWVKGECARQIEKDLNQDASFLRPPQDDKDPGGSYYQKKRAAWRGNRERSLLKV